MPETVIVTVRWQGQEADFELPARLSLASWMDSFRETAKLCFAGLRTEGRSLRLYAHGACLGEGDTMEQAGLYDGEILELKVREEGNTG